MCVAEALARRPQCERLPQNNGRNLFADFSAVAEKTKTYTAFDYADIMEHLIKRWSIADRHFDHGDAAAAQVKGGMRAG